MNFIDLIRAELDDLYEQRDAKTSELDAFADLLESEKRNASDDEDELVTLAVDALRQLGDTIAAKEARVAELEKLRDSRRNTPEPTRRAHKRTADDPYDIELRTAPRTPETRREIEDRAHKALDAEQRMTASQKEHVDAMLRNRGLNMHGAFARHLIATGRPEYRSAFAKLVRMNNAGAYFTPEEAAALEEVRAINVTTDGEGGYLMPFTLDPTVVLVNDGRTNPMRMLATVRTVATDNWQGVNTAGVTASWDDESEEVSDDSPTFTQPAIAVKNIKAFIPYTVEAEDDFDGLSQDATQMFNDAVDDLEATGFATGSTSKQPQGIVTGLVAASSTVASATTDTYARADLYAVSDAVPDRYDAGASWLMHRGIISLTRELGVDDDPVRHIGGGAPPELLDRPLYKYSALDGTITAAADNYIAVVGDIARCYRINDRIGLTVERVPMLFGANGRPTGERGWFARKRVGAGVVDGNAARVLNVT